MSNIVDNIIDNYVEWMAKKIVKPLERAGWSQHLIDFLLIGLFILTVAIPFYIVICGLYFNIGMILHIYKFANDNVFLMLPVLYVIFTIKKHSKDPDEE